MSLLESINSPLDLKKISPKQFPQLAQEIRDFLIGSVSKTGGHIGPSLGVVELTIALHYVYNSPIDKIVFDVGHQAYTHKLLTGRRNNFGTLRQFKGISGFPHTTENIHDAVTVGHASTSISSALGLAKARDLRKKDGEVVAVIGDGSLTGGLAFEGLNNLGHSKTRMTVILNDNEMAIANNVGAVSKYLTKVITAKKYNEIKAGVWNKLDTIAFGGIGKKIQSTISNLNTSVKRVFVPGGLFEDLGLRYIGPIDGHNFDELISALKYAHDENAGPLLIHVLTQKGKGFRPAETDREKFHGLGAFDINTGETKSSGSTWNGVFGEEIINLAEKDDKIVAITAAMPDGTGLSDFAEKFPERFFDVGIAEEHAVSFAAGLALNGMKPIVALYSSFLQRAYDQLIHDVALDNLHVVFAIDRAGLVGADGPTHHGAFDLSYLRTIPNAVILTPATDSDLKFMMKYALNDLNCPVFIRYPRGEVLQSVEAANTASTKLYEMIEYKAGKKVCILAVGHFLQSALDTAELLECDKISTAVISVKQVKPLTKELYLAIFQKFDYIVLCEENTIVGGYCSAVLEITDELISEQKIAKAPKFIRVAYPDEFIEQGTAAELASEIGMSPKQVAEKIVSAVRG